MMKRVLALIMAMVLLLSLAACGNNAATNSGTSTTEATVGQMTPEEKQALYADFFTSENFKTAGESLKISNEYVSISVVNDKSDNAMVEIRVLENYIRLYRLQDGKQYIHVKLEDEEGNPEENWVEYKGETEQDAIGATEMDLSVADVDFESVTRVSYEETKDGTDVVKVYQKNPEYDEKLQITEYVITFKYHDVDCEMVVTVETDGEGGEGATYDTEKVAEDFEIFDYTVDYENKVLINDMDDSEKIPFEITSQKEIKVDEEISFAVYIDEETQAVTSMEQMYEGELSTVEFFQVESCMEGVTLPETMETCNEEDLAMLVFAILFSAMEIGTE